MVSKYLQIRERAKLLVSCSGEIMSKGSGMGQKRNGERINMDKCDDASHSKHCGRAKEVSKGNKKWMSPEKEIEIELNPDDIFIEKQEDVL